MAQDNNEKVDDNTDEVSLKDVFTSFFSGITYLKSKWLIILICSTFGGLIGVAYATFKKPLYIARCTFVLEENNKGAGLGQLAGLASVAGLDLNGGGTGGIFQGDNILELYKSRLMIEKALLSEAIFDGKKELLIDRYIDFNELRTKWKRKDGIDNIAFTGDPDKFNRKQDSIITDLTDIFNKSVLDVSKLDKKLSIILVNVTSKDEQFAKEFTNTLVQDVNNFYIQTKTKKSSQSVRVLQKQADSVKQVLNSALSGVASAMEDAPNANQLYLSLKVPTQRRQIDVQASTVIYSELVKNLEISKSTLRQDMPLIQVIDKPVLPLKVDKTRKLVGVVAGSILGLFLTSLFLISKKMLDSILNS
jgi:hypothetical protein